MNMKMFAKTSAMSLAMAMSTMAPMAVMAQEDVEENANTGDPACMKVAIDKRETAIIGAVDTFNAAVKAAHEARKTALMSAWDKATVKERRQAIRDARKAFKMSAKEARQTLREARKDAWNTFQDEAQACGYNASKDDGSAKEDQGLTA